MVSEEKPNERGKAANP